MTEAAAEKALSFGKDLMERIHTLAIQQTEDTEFIQRVEEASGQRVSRCYQCGNCSASCAYTYVYDYPVNQIMRLLQLGQRDVVLHSRSIWLCAACQACTTRCPCNLDVARIMETLRIMSREEACVSQPDIKVFFDEFLRSVKLFGRVFETGLLPVYNLRSKRLLTDMDLAPRVIRKGKLALWPHRIKDRGKVAGIFDRCEALEGNREGHGKERPGK